ncbi:hypothetical protein CEN39_22130, partial [Fischerella thermalis CCMEE 5201]
NPYFTEAAGASTAVALGGSPPRPRCLTTALAPPLGSGGPEFPSPWEGRDKVTFKLKSRRLKSLY